MNKNEIKHELIETAIWLVQIVGLLLLVVGGIIYHGQRSTYVGGLLCTAYFVISAFRSRHSRRQAVMYSIMAVVLAGLLIGHYLSRSL
ncbi:MAG: hypothetical protein SOX17_00055 [Prevotella sp.]|nr:hypothetical protein [Prevotella sp.]MDD7606432.1 hypothetical protein [Prevotellaceae bacterium]MDY3246888.1 hypothetical protein [Prevotella sp.]